MIQQQPMMVAQSLPFNVTQQAEMAQLGILSNIYKPRISSPIAVLGIAGGVILASIILFIFFLIIDYIVGILIIIPILAIIYAIIGLTNCSLRTYEFTHGLIKVKGNRVEVIRWDQVESVWQEIKTNHSMYFAGGVLGALLFGGTKTNYRVRCRDGATVIFDSHFQNIDLLGTTIQQEVAQAHLPHAIIAFDTGQQITFGPIAVNNQGVINNKGTLLPWFQVRGVKVEKNVVTILQDGKSQKWISTPLAKVPNVGVLTGLVDYATQSNGQSGGW